MTLTSKPLAMALVVLLFGGIAISSSLGWWQTESTKTPATYTEGEFAGLANPADIRGSYTFGDIAASFEVTPEILAQAFQVTSDNPAAFAIKELETMYLDSGYEIGTNSIRLFVAYYLGLPFDTTDQEIYLPQPATDILLEKANLGADQLAYLQAYTVAVMPASSTEAAAEPAVSEEPAAATESAQTETEAEEYVIKGKTTFGELIQWGLPQEIIEGIIGAALPDPAMKVKDYASANGLDFEAIKTTLQLEVDKVVK